MFEALQLKVDPFPKVRIEQSDLADYHDMND